MPSPLPIAESTQEGAEYILQHLTNASDSRFLPEALQQQRRQASRLQASSYKPGLYETSEFFYGSVTVGVVFIKGKSQNSWKETQKEKARKDIAAAMSYWQRQAPLAKLSFVYDFKEVTLGYDPRDVDSEQWVKQVMDSLGYGRWSNIWDDVFHYNDALRAQTGTNWAFTLFIYDAGASFKKFDGIFYNYSMIGGPYTAYAYNEILGQHFWNSPIIAHETGHIFYALDEYEEAEEACDEKIGYLAVANENSEFGQCQLDQYCIMRGSTRAVMQGTVGITTPICTYTFGQIGMRDSDSDKIIDILDTTPLIENVVVANSAGARSTLRQISGVAREQPLPNQNPWGTGQALTLNRINAVQYSIDQGPWQNASAQDGVWDSAVESFTFQASGYSSLRLKAVSSIGNESALVELGPGL
jgi:hypothetical protein